jgi:hypothetical protein
MPGKAIIQREVVTGNLDPNGQSIQDIPFQLQIVESGPEYDITVWQELPTGGGGDGIEEFYPSLSDTQEMADMIMNWAKSKPWYQSTGTNPLPQIPAGWWNGYTASDRPAVRSAPPGVWPVPLALNKNLINIKLTFNFNNSGHTYYKTVVG